MGIAKSSLKVQTRVELDMSVLSERGLADTLQVGQGLQRPCRAPRVHKLQSRRTWKQLRK